MSALSHTLFAALLLLALPSSAPAANAADLKTCPPKDFDSVSDFMIKAYVGNAAPRPWYIQEQMPNAYQPESQLFCVRALYLPMDPSNLNKGITVVNSARNGSTSGPVVGSTGSGASESSSGRTGPVSMSLIAFPATQLSADGSSSSGGPTGASKLRVGPGFLAGQYLAGNKDIFGPYWIVAVGKSADGTDYDWAIVSGGAPKTATKDGCVVGPLNPGPADVNNSGLWLFSRKPIDPTNTTRMRETAKKLGFDLSVLKKVQHEGCTYPSVNTTNTSSGSNTGGSSSSGSGNGNGSGSSKSG